MTPGSAGDARLAWRLALPALVALGLVLAGPLGWTVWDSFHVHDLRMPGAGRPFAGLANYREALSDARFLGSLARTAFFVAVSVGLELLLGMGLALALHRSFRGRGMVRALALLPWAIPTVVAALLWRFFFEGNRGIVNRILAGVGATAPSWFSHASLAWVPILLADVWKTTPFVALVLLAGLAAIPPELHESARIDGAGRARAFAHVTLPLLRPAIVVAVLFRSLDAVRVFDLIWVMTTGGPGSATEPAALYVFQVLLQNLRFGYGSSLSVIVFLLALALSIAWVRAVGRDPEEGRP